MSQEKTVEVDVLIRLKVTLTSGIPDVSGVLIDRVMKSMDFDFIDLTGKAIFEEAEMKSFELVKPLGVSPTE